MKRLVIRGRGTLVLWFLKIFDVKVEFGVPRFGATLVNLIIANVLRLDEDIIAVFLHSFPFLTLVGASTCLLVRFLCPLQHMVCASPAHKKRT